MYRNIIFVHYCGYILNIGVNNVENRSKPKNYLMHNSTNYVYTKLRFKYWYFYIRVLMVSVAVYDIQEMALNKQTSLICH